MGDFTVWECKDDHKYSLYKKDQGQLCMVWQISIINNPVVSFNFRILVCDMGDFAVCESIYGHKYFSCKKNQGYLCKLWQRSISSTIQRYDLSLESPTLFTEKGSGNMKRTVHQTQSLSRDLLHFLELVVPNSPRFVEADLCGPHLAKIELFLKPGTGPGNLPQLFMKSPTLFTDNIRVL